MDITDRLRAAARQIANEYQVPDALGRIVELQGQIQIAQIQLKDISDAADFAGKALGRAEIFVPSKGAAFYCPNCWITKETKSVLRPAPGHVMTCDVCGNSFPVEDTGQASA
jgi:predicted RNA-binding Zn-ribbon protein involved in translation (DUF1610 family)